MLESWAARFDRRMLKGSPHDDLSISSGPCSVECLTWWLRQSRICLQCGKLGFDPWVGKIPERRAPVYWRIHSSILAWRIPMHRGAWWAAVMGSQRGLLSQAVFSHTHLSTLPQGLFKPRGLNPIPEFLSQWVQGPRMCVYNPFPGC